MTPENNTQCWRDLADQLTPQQVAELEEREAGYRHRATLPEDPWTSWEPRTDRAIEDALLHDGRRHAHDNLIAALMSDVPPLPDAKTFGYWETDDEHLCRFVSTPTRSVDGTKIRVLGAASQLADGSILIAQGIDVPQVRIDELSRDGYMTEVFTLSPGQARNLAAALLNTADQIDGWIAR
ncbi:hypothetical protein [Mycobacterium mantenii]|nr:hypothetical protein [Mycobacterium mantenii]